MKKILIFTFYLVLATDLLYAKTGNFKISESCLLDIQKKRDSSIDKYYTSLVFSKDVVSAKEESTKQIMKKINLLIGATSTLYFKNESSSKNNIYLANKTQKEFKQSIESISLDLDISNINKTEYYCYEKDELFFLSLVKKEDIYQKTKEKLKQISIENKNIYSSIQKNENVLAKTLLFNKINVNYLPYLMILESSKKYQKIQKNYFKEIEYYQKMHNEFLKNLEVYISISYPYNRVYTIEERVDEVRQKVIKYLAKYSIYATAKDNQTSLKEVLNKTKKEIAVISIKLNEIEDRMVDEDSYTGSEGISFHRLEFRLLNTIKPKMHTLKEVSSIYINFPEYARQWQLNPSKKVEAYNQKNDFIKMLANIPIRYTQTEDNPSSSSGSKIIRDHNLNIVKDKSTGLQWQDNELSPEVQWKDASLYCKKLELDGSGWRLPSLDELKTIIDKKKKNPSISDVFLNTSASYYWTEESKDGLWYIDRGTLTYWDKYARHVVAPKDRFEIAWYVSFSYGYEYVSNANNKYHVRCVRR